jgi:hypothetical protein
MSNSLCLNLKRQAFKETLIALCRVDYLNELSIASVTNAIIKCKYHLFIWDPVLQLVTKILQIKTILSQDVCIKRKHF